MISLESVEQTILELESKDTSFANCERLAWLYIVRDNLRKYAPKTPEQLSIEHKESEFLRAVNGRNANAVWAILDEHMDAVRIVFPKEYEAVIQRIQSIHDTHQP